MNVDALAAELARLPHGEAFRYVTRVTGLETGAWAEGVWALDGSEWFFAAHFPGEPVVPGVLLGEAMAQMAGIALGSEGMRLARVDVKFPGAARPPAEIALRARLTRQIGPMALFDVSATCAGATVAAGQVTLAGGGRS